MVLTHNLCGAGKRRAGAKLWNQSRGLVHNLSRPKGRYGLTKARIQPLPFGRWQPLSTHPQPAEGPYQPPAGLVNTSLPHQCSTPRPHTCCRSPSATRLRMRLGMPNRLLKRRRRLLTCSGMRRGGQGRWGAGMRYTGRRLRLRLNVPGWQVCVAVVVLVHGKERSRHATATETEIQMLNPNGISNPAHRLDAVSLGSPIQDIAKRLVCGGLHLHRQAEG